MLRSPPRDQNVTGALSTNEMNDRPVHKFLRHVNFRKIAPGADKSYIRRSIRREASKRRWLVQVRLARRDGTFNETPRTMAAITILLSP